MGWPLDRCHVSGGLARFVATRNNVSSLCLPLGSRTSKALLQRLQDPHCNSFCLSKTLSEQVSRHGATGRSARADGVRHPPQHAAVLIQGQHLAALRQQVVRAAATARSAPGAGPIDPHSWCQSSPPLCNGSNVQGSPSGRAAPLPGPHQIAAAIWPIVASVALTYIDQRLRFEFASTVPTPAPSPRDRGRQRSASE